MTLSFYRLYDFPSFLHFLTSKSNFFWINRTYSDSARRTASSYAKKSKKFEVLKFRISWTLLHLWLICYQPFLSLLRQLVDGQKWKLNKIIEKSYLKNFSNINIYSLLHFYWLFLLYLVWSFLSRQVVCRQQMMHGYFWWDILFHLFHLYWSFLSLLFHHQRTKKNFTILSNDISDRCAHIFNYFVKKVRGNIQNYM